MKRGYDSKRIYQVRLASGEMGWRTRLQNVYSNYNEWQSCNCLYKLNKRLGGSVRKLWNQNPIIQGGTSVADYQIVK